MSSEVPAARVRSRAGRPRSPAPQLPTLAARRAPVQGRSRQAVDRMLVAAAELFAERGFEATTTDAIAARAGVAVGSVYRFFPNKSAIVRALYDGYVARVDALFAELATGPLPRGARARLRRAIELFAAFHRADTGFRALWTSGHSSRELVALGFALSAWSAERVAALIAPHVRLRGAALGRVGLVVSESTFALLAAASQEPDARRARALVTEACRLAERYLAPYLVGANGRAPRRR
ncbi:MAG: TetR/AcrR family transcriptional regulator [Myxococcales bacterium]|nr:TetR/AcrR family transcriptional regulator [Myxococcales bacterium]